MNLKSVIHDTKTNSVEATWVEVVTPEQIVPARYIPPLIDDEDNVIEEGFTEPARVIPAVEAQVRCHSYADVQMDMLEADLGADLPAYVNLIATVRAAIVPPTPEELAAQFAALKVAKNLQINDWRGTANKTHFPHGGKLIACDDLSRGDIDAVANSIALTGAFPASFPGAWKAMDNSYIMLPDVDAFKAMHAAMTAQGTANFMHAQTLKTALAAATTEAQVNAIVWD